VGAQPAGNVLWYEAAVFVNWLNTSTAHQAAYNLDGFNMSLWSSAEAWQLGGENLYRHKDYGDARCRESEKRRRGPILAMRKLSVCHRDIQRHEREKADQREDQQSVE
jgi:hypothetical protein